MRFRFVLAGITLFIISTIGDALAQSVNTNRWLRDFDQVRSAIAKNYADLDEAIERQGLNPVAMSNVTIRSIQSAKTDEEARRAIDVFVASFGDPRLKLRAPMPEALSLDDDEAIATTSDATQVCKALRYRPYDPEPFGMGVLSDYTFGALVSQNNLFGAGIIDSGPRGIGYVRIPSFRTQDYYTACLRAWTDRQREGKGVCDADCFKDINERIVPNMIIDDFARHIEALAERRVGTVLVDLTGAKGDGEWAEAIGVLLAGNRVACPRVDVPRSVEWRTRFNSLRRKLARARTSDAAEPLIDTTRDRLKELSDATRETCRRPENMWSDTTFDRSECGGLISGAMASCGLYGRSSGIDMGDPDAQAIIYRPDYFAIANSPKPAKLYIVTDGETYGSAELLAAMLRDGEAADIVGQKTGGAGCRSVEGDDAVTILRRSRLELHVPNCRTNRRDGSNAARGIQPDIPVKWPGDSDTDAAREAIYSAVKP